MEISAFSTFIENISPGLKAVDRLKNFLDRFGCVYHRHWRTLKFCIELKNNQIKKAAFYEEEFSI
ncbi:MAG: hypothetical protein ACOYXC_10345, partial [Candidatus Rifleibacteriota bacterium]